MNFMSYIVSWLTSLEDYVYDAYLEVYGWVYPFWLLSTPLIYISRGFGWLAYYFSLFNNWLYWTNIEIGKILNWNSIYNLIKSYFPNIDKIGRWLAEWSVNVSSIISTWWLTNVAIVQGWIEVARQLLQAQVNSINSSLVTIQANLTNLWASLPSISSLLLDIQALINTAFITRDSLWSGWQDIKDKAINFFTDPEEWLYKALDRIVERFW